MMFNIASEILMRRLVAAPDAAWDCVAMIARQSPADDDRESLVDFQEITNRLAATLGKIEGDAQPAPNVDQAWITKDPKSPKGTDRFSFPEIEPNV